jgi:hypothetical protein
MSEALDLFIAAVNAYHEGVDRLKGSLERDVEEAGRLCWTLKDRPVQVRLALA